MRDAHGKLVDYRHEDWSVEFCGPESWFDARDADRSAVGTARHRMVVGSPRIFGSQRASWAGTKPHG